MKRYKHLSHRDRRQIDVWLQMGKMIAFIAAKLGYHRSTMYREIKRNQSRHHRYHAYEAQSLSVQRRRGNNKISKSPVLRKLYTKALKAGVEPGDHRWKNEAAAQTVLCLPRNDIPLYLRLLQQAMVLLPK